jgi:hypothetical protein
MKYGWILLALLAGLAIGCGSSNNNSGGEDTFGPNEDTIPAVGCTTSDQCPGDLPYCHVGEKICVECTKNEQCPTEKAFCNAQKHACAECVMDLDCGEGRHCLDGTCSDKACWPKSKVCVGNSVHTCSDDGSNPHYKVDECGQDTCYNGECLVCVPSKTSCLDNQVIECDSDGEDYEVLKDCGEKECIGNQCVFCYPGNKECDGNVSMVCGEDGEHWEVAQDCSANGFSCTNGTCVSPCAGDIKNNTNAGCEFYAVDLHNYDLAALAQFAVIASNTSTEFPATVTITYPDNTDDQQVIQPSSLGTFLLPSEFGIETTEVSKKGFRITSTIPITVYQFNPLENEEVYSNDASVLLPTPGLGTEYYVASFKGANSFFTIVGTSSVDIEVTFTVTAPTVAGGGIPALNPGQSHTITVKQGDTVNVETADSSDPASWYDLSGTHIVASGPIAVHGGNSCSNVGGERCCCDHIEHQLMPVSTWGARYLISKTWPRWQEKDYVRVMASKNGTTVTVTPAVASVPTLNAGQFYTFQTDKDVEVKSNDPAKPIQVTQFLASSYEIVGPKWPEYPEECNSNNDCPAFYTCEMDDWTGAQACQTKECSDVSQCPSGHTCHEYWEVGTGYCEAIGDPAMMVTVPEEQFQDSYVFLTPNKYLQDYLNIIAPTNAQTVVLDGNQVNPASFSAIGNTGYSVYRTKVNDGSHTIWSDKKIGIMVYGYDDDVSYGYAGGMGLIKLN